MKTALLIDSGNTRLKWACVSPSMPLGQYIATGNIFLSPENITTLENAWQSLTTGFFVEHILISHVASEQVKQTVKTLLLKIFGTISTEWLVATRARAGLHNAYHRPSHAGADRFAAAIGARQYFPGQTLLIANCGTATTLDVVADDTFIGGMILPGLKLMVTALTQGAALLSTIDPLQVAKTRAKVSSGTSFPNNTLDAIAQGCLHAQASAIDMATRQLLAQYTDIHCIVAGGAAPFILPLLTTLPCPVDVVDNLVIMGLHTICAAPSSFQSSPTHQRRGKS